MANEENQKRDNRTAEEKLVSATAALHAKSIAEEAARVEIEALKAAVKSRDEEILRARDARNAAERALESGTQKLEAATAVATADIGKRCVALVDIIDHDFKRDENGDPARDSHGNILGLKKFVKVKKGEVMPFDPKHAPPGYSGLRLGHEYAYR